MTKSLIPSQDFINSFNYWTTSFDKLMNDKLMNFESPVNEPDYEIKSYDHYDEIKISTLGFEKDDISLILEKNILKVEMTKNENNNSKHKSISFKGVNVSKDSISASYKDGVLTIEIPREKEKEPDNTIPID